MSVATREARWEREAAQEREAAGLADKPLSQGSYAVYRTDDGGLHLVYRPVGTTEDQHMPIPAFVVNLAQKAAGGQDLGPLAFLLGQS